MVEALGAVAATLGILTFIRNATQTILVDKNAWQQYATKLVALMEEVELLKDELEIWHIFWHVQEGTPLAVLEGYWGLNGAQRILRCALRVRECTAKLEADVTKYFRSIKRLDAEEALCRSGNLHLAPLQNDLKQRLEDLRSKASIVQKTKGVVYRDKVFGENLSAVKQSIKLLGEQSERLLKLRYRMQDRDWMDDLKYIALREHISSLATDPQFRDRVDTLHAHICTSSIGNIDLYLDHDASQDSRLETLFASACSGAMLHSFHISADRTHALMSASWRHCIDAQAIDQLDQILVHQAVEAQKYQLEPGPHGLNVSLEACGCDHKKTQSLRSFLAVRKGKKLTLMERSRLAYEVAENTLIFLRTNWLKSLCSCRIQRSHGPNWQIRYTTRVSNVQHQDPDTGEVLADATALDRPWCEDVLGDDPLHRLGLLLTEIALSRPLGDVHHHKNKERIKIDLDLDSTNTNDTERFTEDGLAARIGDEEDEFSTDLAEIVFHCFQSHRAFAASGTELDMRQFFDKIVWPLWLHYEAEVVKPLQRKRLRKPEDNQFLTHWNQAGRSGRRSPESKEQANQSAAKP